ncbi:trypsin-like peptidase domain-containing protein [Saccharicrinis sp. FJH62]|uniref:trypsin-like peptidase domain-containing protein n=1 Tax=Saccharicrinis sp. FJH62 TaxID=3344657 RepID=UPI0035D4522F
MRTFPLVILLSLVALCSTAQISHGGKPVGISAMGMKRLSFDEVKMPEIRSALKSQSFDADKIHLKTLKFAESFPVDLTPDNSGVWSTLSDGSKVWRLLVSSEGAKSLNIIFSKYHIPSGAQLFIYNPEMTQILGSFTSANNKASGILPVMPLDGDKLIVEYIEPANVAFGGELEIGTINHDFMGINDILKDIPIGNFGSSQACEVNLSCENGWDQQSQSVVKMIIDGNELCSGSLINNTAEDGTPYVLTAAHCYTDHSFNAYGTIFIFNYQVPNCYNTIEGSREQTVAGGYMRAYSEQEEFKNSDYALVEMSVIPPAAYRAYYSGWDASVTSVTDVVAIHHPNGDVKKISRDEDAVGITSLIVNNYYYKTYSHWWIKDWESGVTEGGSSGCPLFNQEGYIIGALSAGQASCTNMINDFFFCLSKVWTSHSDQTKTLKYWLDPLNSGSLKLDGYIPEELDTVERISNVKKGEDINVVSLGSNGYLGGFNKAGITKYAEHYQLTEGYEGQVLGLYFVPQLGSASSASSINFKVWEGGAQPGNELWSKQVYIKEWLRTQKIDGTVSKFGNTGGYYTKAYYNDKENFIEIDENVETGNDFYAGYEIVSNGPVDTFALYQVVDRGGSGENTAWFYQNDAWNTFPNYSGSPVNSSLYVDAVVRIYKNPSDTFIPTNNKKIVKFIEPSPAIGDYFTLHFTDPLSEDAVLSVYTLNGTKIDEKNMPSGSSSYDETFATKASGIYILRIIYQSKTEVYRVVNLSNF